MTKGPEMLFYLILILLIMPSVHAYIDPGTGGYLLYSMWGWLVGIATLIAALVVHFFKYRLKSHWTKASLKYKLIIITIPLIAILGVSGFSIYQYNSGYKLPDYDPDLVNVTLNTAQAYDGYTLIEGKLIDMDGTIVHEWPYWYLGVIDDNGDFYAQQGYESSRWGRYSWNGSVIWEMDLPDRKSVV